MSLAPDLADRAAPPLGAGGARLTRRRNPLLATVCALLTVGCALAAYLLTTRAAGRVEVVQIDAAVPVGAPLTRIVPAEVAADSHLDYVLWSQRDQLGRYRAVTALVPGQLLFAAELTTRPAALAGDLTLGVLVKAGAYPLGLAAGAHVAVILLPATGTTPASPGSGATGGGGVSLIPDATVAQVTAAAGTDPTAALAAVSLYLPPSQAEAVAQAAAAGQIALALTGSGP